VIDFSLDVAIIAALCQSPFMLSCPPVKEPHTVFRDQANMTEAELGTHFLTYSD